MAAGVIIWAIQENRSGMTGTGIMAGGTGLTGVGMMETAVWYKYQGSWYYLGADGAMAKGQQTLTVSGISWTIRGGMLNDPVTLTPDQDGALRWPGLTK